METTIALRERVKKLTALHGCLQILRESELPLDAVLAGIAGLLPPAFLHSDLATARVRLGEKQGTAGNHRPSPNTLRLPFTTDLGEDGDIEVAYHALALPPGEPAFLPEETALLDSIAQMLRVDVRRRRAVEALDAERERLALALVVAQMGIWDWDVQTNVVRWSPQLARMVGEEGALRGKFSEYSHWIHPDDRGPTLDAIAAAVRPGSPKRFELELRLTRPGGGYRQMCMVGEVTRLPDGAALRVLAVLSDITERRTLETQLRQAQRLEAMGLVASGVAHDFNNLLAVILSNSRYLDAEATEGSETRELAREIQTAARSGSALTRQLLTFARRTEHAPSQIELAPMVDALAPMLRRIAGKAVTLTTVHGAEPLCVRADEGDFEQVMLNLVVNARDAMPHGGRLAISTRGVTLAPDPAWPAATSGPGAELAVSDTGTGISPEIRARLFEPFFTTKAPGKGTGLGLSVVVGVAHRWRGQVLVETEVGVGTTFRVQLPIG